MSAPSVRVLCPAKINLRLEVRGRRPDGFHEIRTLFQAIDLEDVLEVHPARSLVLEVDDPALDTGQENLVLRAARALATAWGMPHPCARLVLAKRIPVGGGLGGGSSDAAGALLALTRFWSERGTPPPLAGIASRLGSDVAYFLVGGTCFGGGRGERLVPLPPLGDTAVVLGIPPFGISTADVYRRWASRGAPAPLTPPGGGVTVPALFHKLAEKKDFGLVRNDLESVVFDGWPELRKFRDALGSAGASAAAVSGSGSTVFGLFGNRSEAETATVELGTTFPTWRLVLASTMARGARIEVSGRGDAAGSGE